MRRRSTRVAWGLLAVFGAIFLATNVLSAANGDFRTQPLVEVAPLWLAFSAFMVVGALIVAHRPDNPIGWIFSAIALLAAGGGLAETYGRYAYETRPGSLPGAIVDVWFAWSSWYPTVALAMVYTPLLFPTGRLLSPPWRPVAWAAGAVTAAIVALAVLQPTFVLDSGRTVDNPIGVAATPHPEDSTAGTVLTALLLSSMLAAFASMVVRFRRSGARSASSSSGSPTPPPWSPSSPWATSCPRWPRPEHNCPLGTAVVPAVPCFMPHTCPKGASGS